MNEYIIQKWNSVVKKDDIVYHLGDVGFGSLQEVKSLVERLNGTKILLKGNHDFKIGTNAWKEIGFSEVYKKKIVLGNLLLTHAPTEEVEENQINVFGHIHDKPLDERFDKDNHICVSCDVVDYTLVSMDRIIENNKVLERNRVKNVLLIHGFNGTPKIFDYFKQEFEKQNYNVILPDFPVREEITVEKYFNVFDRYQSYFNKNLIVVAHSIGNPMFIKYISKNNLNIGQYISLAGFSRAYYNEGKDVLNEKVKLTILTKKEKDDAKRLILKRNSIYSDNDHIVPFDILEEFCQDIDSEAMLIKNIGHMGKKSGLEELPEVIKMI